MTWIELLVAAIKAIVLGIAMWREKDKRRKELKRQAYEDLKLGIKERDPAKITMAFDRARRV